MNKLIAWLKAHSKLMPALVTALGALVAQGILEHDALVVARVVLIVATALTGATYVAPANHPAD